MEILQYFELIPIISAVLWLVLIFLFAGLVQSRRTKNEINKYFLSQVYFRVFMALFYGVFYLLYYGGGDTTAYWDGAISLHNLFMNSPINYISEMWQPSNMSNLYENFNSATGYPPGWIYREPESFFVSKILSIFSLITFKSYLATTAILGCISSFATWKFYTSLRSLKISNEKWLTFGILFLPSVAFWCSGISKDTFIYICICLVVSFIIEFFKTDRRIKNSFYWVTFIAFFVIFKTRNYVLVALLPGFFIGLSILLTKKATSNALKKFLIRVFFIGLGVSVLALFIQIKSFDSILEEIITIQQDFNGNSTYTGARYDLNISDYSTFGIIKSIPAALLASLYRPFPWESFSPTLILNGLESLILIFLSIRFFKNGKTKIKQINSSSTLTTILVFLLIMGFSIGFSSGLFGVLVRFKAIILPLFIVLLTISGTPESLINSKHEN
ncbi:MAG: hypothetical protein WC044_04990 [Crocinitomicaceae bacterium]